MIGIVGLFIANKAIFLHAHKFADGTTIEHAHPYDKSNDSEPFKTHHHSSAEFLFFQNLEILFLIVFLTLALSPFLKKKKVSKKLTTEHTLICLNLYKGRSPPVS
ncbi:MAG: hypothetical protein RBS23_05490 [Mariniphaga sp.]|jgi:hypothetical protein|nr:hypothetical protein [Mariniphaga sp.]